MTFPVEYVSTSKNRQGGISYIVRLLSRHDTCIWAGGQARQYLLRFGPYLQEELDARILRGAPADITYRIVHVSKENPQAELLLGPSWDGWAPSILD